jgi:N-acetylneuraminic acid mutarotase
MHDVWTPILITIEKICFTIAIIYTLILFEVSIGYGSTEVSKAEKSNDPFWSRGEEMPTPRTEVLAEAVNEKIYVIGGVAFSKDGTRQFDIVEVYDTKNDEWAQDVEPLPVPIDHSVAVEYNGKIYVVGGFLDDKIPTDKLFIYDPSNDKWTNGAPLPSPRGALAAEFVNGTLYAFGGLDSSQTVMNTNWAYNPDTDAWTEKAPMPTARHHLASAVVDGKIYAIGGRTLGNGVNPPGVDVAESNFDKNEMYDPITDKWTFKQPMHDKRSGFPAAALDGQIYVFGGQRAGHGVFESAERYDPSSDSWAYIAPLPSARMGLEAVGLNKKIYTIGGQIQSEDDGLISLDVNEILNFD